MAILPSIADQPVLMNLFKTFPETVRPLMEYHEVLLRREDSPLTKAERELIAAYVSRINGCRYCAGIHTATTELLGTEEGLVDLLAENFDEAPVDERMKPLLEIAGKLTRDPGSISEEDAQAVYEQGWSEQALFEAVSVCALFNLMNRLVEGLGITYDPDYAKQSAKRLEEIGYTGFADFLGV